MPNIIDAIIHLTSNADFELRQYAGGSNRANDMGVALEEYIKDLFACTLSENVQAARIKKFSPRLK